MRKIIPALLLMGGLVVHAEGLEEVYVDFIMNDKIHNGFYSIYSYQGKNWIEINDLIKFLGDDGLKLKNGDHLVGTYNFRKFNIDLSRLEDGFFRRGDRSYVDLESLPRLREFRSADFDEEKLQLKVYTTFKLKEEDKPNQNEVTDYKEEPTLEEDWKIFTPGIMNIRYNQNTLSKGDSSTNIAYTNHLFYGNLNLDYQLRNREDSWDDEITNFRWERNVLNNKRLIIGDVYQDSGPFQVDTSQMRGVALSRKGGWDYSTRVTKKDVRGFAPSGTIVELYRNNVLVGYEVVSNSEYVFDIEYKTGDLYYLRMYYPDGRREQIEIDRLSGNDIIGDDEFDYEFQLGDAEEGNGTIYLTNFYYGLTETTTVGIGSYNIRDNEEALNDFLTLSSATRADLLGNPYSLSIDYMRNGEDSSYIVDYNHKLSKMFSYGVFYEDSSKMVNYFNGYGRNLELSIGGNLKGLGYSISYEREWCEEREAYNEYKLSLNRGIGNFYSNFDVTRIEDYNKYSLGTSYYFRNLDYLDSIGGNISKQTNERESLSYQFYILKNHSILSGLSYKLVFEDGDDTESKAAFEFTYQFGNIFEIGSYGNSTNSDTVGMYINTGLNFAKEGKIDYHDHGDSSVEGKIFLDSNADGEYQEGEEPLSNIGIGIVSGAQAISDEGGKFLISGISSKVERKLTVYGDQVDIFYALPGEKKIKTLPGGLMQVLIPVVEMQTLSGKINFSDNFYYEEVKEVLENSELVVTNVITKKEYRTTLTDENYILDIPAGDYKVDFIYKGDLTIVIESAADYHIDIKSTENLHDVFKINISKTELYEDDVYILEVTGVDDYFENKIYRISKTETIDTASYRGGDK